MRQFHFSNQIQPARKHLNRITFSYCIVFSSCLKFVRNKGVCAESPLSCWAVCGPGQGSCAPWHRCDTALCPAVLSAWPQLLTRSLRPAQKPQELGRGWNSGTRAPQLLLPSPGARGGRNRKGNGTQTDAQTGLSTLRNKWELIITEPAKWQRGPR